jgi:hypothetical protein
MILWKSYGNICECLFFPGKLTENTFSFTTWGIVTGERRRMNEPIVN